MALFGKGLDVQRTPIPDLMVVTMPVHGDSRGWFKENWQRSKMTRLGLPDFQPVQQNISFNETAGVTRGLHAEPWDKYVSVATGRVYGAWIDLREGPSFGTVYSHEIDPSVAVFVPRGVANGFQVLEDNTAYTYLVTAHWSPDAQYTEVSIYDTSLDIAWPIPLDQAVVSDKDQHNSDLKDVTPIAPLKVMIVGANGQLGRALQQLYPDADLVTRSDFDITDPVSVRNARDWSQYSLILNAAAYTKVDDAEKPENRQAVWGVNVDAVANLATICNEYNLTLVHISSDYVFNGKQDWHTEDEPLTPLGVYGMSKAAGDRLAATAHKHFIVRTSWVVGDGANFVRTMAALAREGKKPSVVNDQIGRLTFTSTLAEAIKHLVDSGSPFGTYNVSNTGVPWSWHEIAKHVFKLLGTNPEDVTGVTTEEYFAGKPNVAPRPAISTLNTDKLLHTTGYYPSTWYDELAEYLKS